MDMGLIVGNFIFFVIILGVLVTVHEYGHFWVARRHYELYALVGILLSVASAAGCSVLC